MVSVSGNISNLFTLSTRSSQTKTQDILDELRKGQGTRTSPPRQGIQDLVDPDTRARLEARKQDADALSAKLASGRDDPKAAAARKKEEVRQKLKLLKLQAQLAAASGDRKAAARIAKEVAAAAKELGQVAKDYSGGAAPANSPSADADTSDAAAATQSPADQAAPTDATAPDTSSRDDLQAKRDAIIKEGATQAADAQFESDTRQLFDQLRALHRQARELARKGGSNGTKAELERADRDFAEGERNLDEAFGPPGPSPQAFTNTARIVDIKL